MEHLKLISPFKLSETGFRYLGIHVTSSLKDLIKHNYTPLIEKLKPNLKTWCSLPISFLGRINVIKMNVLPKFLYLFQSIPSYLANSFFKDLNKNISKFIWNNKRPRIKISKLMKPKDRGGIGLPNLQLYYWAAQIKNMISWCNERTNSSWFKMEETACSPLPIKYLPFVKNYIKLKKISEHFIISNTLRTWKDVKTHMGISSPFSLFSPLSFNPDMPLTLQNTVFSAWRELGISQISCLLSEGTIKSFQQIVDQYNVPKSNFYKYLQLRHFLKPKLDKGELRSKTTEIEYLLLNSACLKGLITRIYDTLSNNCTSAWLGLKDVWEKDIGQTIEENDWEIVCDNIYPKCTSLGIHELNFKFFNRIYLTPIRIKKMFANATDLCFKCKKDKGTIIHSFWDCGKILPFWKKIHKVLENILKLNFDMTPALYLLNLNANNLFEKDAFQLFIVLVYLAKKCILLLWSASQAPSFKMWISQIATWLPLEKLTYDKHKKSDRFWSIWSPLWEYIKELS